MLRLPSRERPEELPPGGFRSLCLLEMGVAQLVSNKGNMGMGQN